MKKTHYDCIRTNSSIPNAKLTPTANSFLNSSLGISPKPLQHPREGKHTRRLSAEIRENSLSVARGARLLRDSSRVAGFFNESLGAKLTIQSRISYFTTNSSSSGVAQAFPGLSGIFFYFYQDFPRRFPVFHLDRSCAIARSFIVRARGDATGDFSIIPERWILGLLL